MDCTIFASMSNNKPKSTGKRTILRSSESGEILRADSKRSAKSPRKDSYVVAGVTRDGVAILKVSKATHFTDSQAREAVRSVAASRLVQSNTRAK